MPPSIKGNETLKVKDCALDWLNEGSKVRDGLDHIVHTLELSRAYGSLDRFMHDNGSLLFKITINKNCIGKRIAKAKSDQKRL